MKNLLIASLLLVSTSVFADIITQEVSFGTQGSSNDVAIGSLNQTLSVNAFNTALGTLTGVNIMVFGQMDSTGSSQNQSVADGRADIGISIFQDWKVSSSVANDYVFKAAGGGSFLSASSAPEGTFNLITGTANDTFAYDLSSGELSGALAGVDYSAFTLGNDIDFVFTGFAQTIITNNVDSGTGFFRNSFQTGSWGKIAISYEFDPVVTIPEPATFVIFSLGLMGILARSLKKHL